jgi:hypothetical protein
MTHRHHALSPKLHISNKRSLLIGARSSYRKDLIQDILVGDLESRMSIPQIQGHERMIPEGRGRDDIDVINNRNNTAM